jgi:aspartyl-tRNA(Asn)/glutamyl-tRNA(Gln) amidotransferase subunit B
MEIVTEPDMRSGREAQIFLKELRSVLRELEISDANMEEGNLRM